MKKEKYNIAVVGATGMVGKEIVKILEERKFPVGELRLLASTRSVGTEVWFNNKQPCRMGEVKRNPSITGII